jgi:hypothetical protein
MQYAVRLTPPGTWTPDDRGEGLTVLLRRLANPHLPFNANPADPLYNPYLTVDHLERVPLHSTTEPAYASRGKQQPYASDPSQVADQTAFAGSTTGHTFGSANTPAALPGWLVHLDRQLISPMELLHVSGYHPHQLTHRFLAPDGRGGLQRFGQRVPWFDPGNRLYRVFEFLEARSRAAGVSGEGRVAGKINLNTVWDPETLLALCDPQPSNSFRTEDLYKPLRGPADPPDPNKDDPADPQTVFWRMMKLRSPGFLTGGGPGPDDRPFLSLATGYSTGDQQYPAPRGIGIEDTFLRSFDGGSRRLFQSPEPANANDPAAHPYLDYELLTKVFNQITPRSNVFAVWLTVGFFEVTDDTSRPVKLGREIGRAEGRHLRHRLFAIVDRSVLTSNPGPQPRFDPRAGSPGTGTLREAPASRVVPYVSVID